MVGKVKFFNEKKGFGFIGVEGAEDVFVHYTAINGSGYRKLVQGQVVEFEIQADENGKERAVNVVVKQ